MLLIHTAYTKTYNPLVIVWFVFWYRTPDSLKRMFVLTSLYARLTDDEDMSLQRLQTFSQEFELNSRAKEMKFPALVSRWVWKRLLPIYRVCLKNEDHYVHRLVKKTPCWLWYDDADRRRKDIEQLIAYLQVTQSAHVGGKVAS